MRCARSAPAGAARAGRDPRPIAETNLRGALMTDSNWTTFFMRPLSLIFLVAALLSVGWAVWQQGKRAECPRLPIDLAWIDLA
jgi:hypothetical protein